MRKSSAYARKRVHRIKTVNDLRMEYARQITAMDLLAARCTSYDGNPIFDKKSILLRLHMTLQGFLDMDIPSDDVYHHDILAQAINVAEIRWLEMGGETNNPAMPTLELGGKALDRARERWERTGKWGLDGPGIQQIKNAVYLYEDALDVSTPQQMIDAEATRERWLKLVAKEQKEIA